MDAQKPAAEQDAAEKLEFVQCPDEYGISYDPVFLAERESATSRDQLVRYLKDQRLLALLVRHPDRILGYPISSMFPLAGWEESAFVQSNDWSEDNFAAVSAFLSRYQDWHICRLPMIQPRHLSMLEHFLKVNGLVARRHLRPIRVIAGCASFDDYLKSRGKSFRRLRNRTFERASAAGFEYKPFVGLENWLALYACRHKNMGGGDYSTEGNFQSFFAGLRKRLEEEQRLIEVGLWRNDKIAAAGMGIRGKKVMYFYQTAHDPAQADYRPGGLVFDEMIRIGLDEGFSMISFMGNPDYLRLYTSQVLEFYELETFSRSPAAQLLYAYRALKGAEC